MKSQKTAGPFKINKGFIIQKLEEKTVIFDGEKSTLYTFNATASFLFQKLKSGYNRNRIIALMVKKYGISDKKARNHLDTFLKNLFEKKIITQKTE